MPFIGPKTTEKLVRNSSKLYIFSHKNHKFVNFMLAKGVFMKILFLSLAIISSEGSYASLTFDNEKNVRFRPSV